MKKNSRITQGVPTDDEMRILTELAASLEANGDHDSNALPFEDQPPEIQKKRLEDWLDWEASGRKQQFLSARSEAKH